MSAEQRLKELGIILAEPPQALASYVPGLICGDLAFVSGQLPIKDGVLLWQGKLGRELDLEKGYQAARQAAINCLSVLRWLVGSLDGVAGIVRITGYVQASDDFYQHPQVVNGASDLMEQVFGTSGKHSRVAVGVNSLPLNAPCEIELVARLR